MQSKEWFIDIGLYFFFAINVLSVQWYGVSEVMPFRFDVYLLEIYFLVVNHFILFLGGTQLFLGGTRVF